MSSSLNLDASLVVARSSGSGWSGDNGSFWYDSSSVGGDLKWVVRPSTLAFILTAKLSTTLTWLRLQFFLLSWSLYVAGRYEGTVNNAVSPSILRASPQLTLPGYGS